MVQAAGYAAVVRAMSRRPALRGPTVMEHRPAPGLILTGMDPATEAVAAFLSGLDTEVREVAPGEWGIVLDAAGHVLDVGLAVKGSLLRAQAAVLPAEVINPHQLLYWNRQSPLVSFAQNMAGEVFVCGELPVESLRTETLDRFLGLLLANATRAREFVLQSRAGASPA